MEKTSQYILFVVIASAIAVAFLLFIVVDIVLLYRYKQVKNANKIIEMETRFVREMNEAKVEATQQVMSDIGRELHDNIGQNLTISLMQLARAENEAGIIKQTSELLRQTSKELRQISHLLSGDLMEKLDIRAAFQRIAENVQKTGITANVSAEKMPPAFPKTSELLLLRISQELINNSLKHSGAKNILLTVAQHNGALLLKYDDDGKGFDMKQQSANGIGMRSIEKRLELLGANVVMHSSPGDGFHLEAKISLK